MGQQNNVGIGEICIHEPCEHVFTEDGRKIVHHHPHLKGFLGQRVILRLELVDNIVDQLQIICKRHGFVDTGQLDQKVLNAGNICQVFRVFEIIGFPPFRNLLFSHVSGFSVFWLLF